MPTVDPADIRGLATTLLVSVKRLPRSRDEGRPKPPHNVVEGCAKTGAAPHLRPVLSCCRQAGRGTSFAMAHMKAMSSRAMAVIATFGCLPRVSSLR